MPKLGQKKKRELLKKAAEESGANDAWAMVELYRWQHGELPPQEQGKCKNLVISEALKAMAGAMETPNPTKWPTPFNTASVLRYAAKQLEGQEQLQALAQRVANLNRDAGEIGPGMLAQLVDQARKITPQAPPV